MPIRSSITKKPKPYPEQVVEPPDPKAFAGIPEKPSPGPTFVRCAKCLGHGRWWYIINWLNKPGNREQPCHDCDGVGWVVANACKHAWRFVKYLNIQKTMRQERCSKCKVTRTVDSS